MLVNQAWMASRSDSGSIGGMGGMDGAAMMGPDAGTIAIAVLMFASGVIMTLRSHESMSGGEEVSRERMSGENGP